MRLEGKVAIVTGGAGGIGRGIVRAFAKEGARILFVDIDDESGRELERELAGSGSYLRADISRADSAGHIVATAIDRLGSVHVLVNNAHVAEQASLLDTTQEMFDLSFGTGFYPTVRLMRACYPHLAGNRGSVINFASGAGIDGQLRRRRTRRPRRPSGRSAGWPPTNGPHRTSMST